MRRIVLIGFASAALVSAAGCSKKDDGNKPAPSGAVTAEGTAPAEGAAATEQTADKTDENKVAAEVGVDPGPVEQEGGGLAVASDVKGTVEYRALGTEEWQPLKADADLFAGDQIRTGDNAAATLTLSDESTVEVAESSTVAIGNRDATEDPSSSIAVLSGVVRVSASARAPGEGPFMTYTPVGVVATKGTVFGVGVAADATARVGVETGNVVVSGIAALDTPVEVAPAHVVVIAPAGTVAAPAAWPADDWGTWRVEAEGQVDPKAAAEAHAAAMAQLQTDLDAGYNDLETQGEAVAKFEADAAAKADANDTAGYTAILPEGEGAIDASFDAGLRLQLLTFAYTSRAVLVSDLYVRHPKVVVWAPIAPRVHAAVLWPKRYAVVTTTYFRPLRVQYYVHHPRGRLHATLVGVTVPTFYAAVTPPPPPRVRLRFAVFTPPVVIATASARPVWIGPPAVGWRAKIKVRPAPYRGKVAFWVRPANFRATAVFGVAPTVKIAPVFRVRAAAPVARVQLKAKWKANVGTRIKVAAPDLNAGARARAAYKVKVGGPDIKAGAGVKVGGPGVDVRAPDVKGGVKAGAGVKVGGGAVVKGGAAVKVGGKAAVDAGHAAVKAGGAAVKAGGAAVKGGVKAGVKVGGDVKAGAKAGGNVKAGVKVKTPTPPKAEVKGGVKVKAGGKVKIGN